VSLPPKYIETHISSQSLNLSKSSYFTKICIHVCGGECTYCRHIYNRYILLNMNVLLIGSNNSMKYEIHVHVAKWRSPVRLFSAVALTWTGFQTCAEMCFANFILLTMLPMLDLCIQVIFKRLWIFFYFVSFFWNRWSSHITKTLILFPHLLPICFNPKLCLFRDMFLCKTKLCPRRDTHWPLT
jgi:hypothetical protein